MSEEPGDRTDSFETRPLALTARAHLDLNRIGLPGGELDRVREDLVVGLE